MVILICGQPMIANFKFHILFIVRVGILPGLIFFACIPLTSCNRNKPDEISIIWKDSQAVSIAVPQGYLDGMHSDSLRSAFSVSLDGEKTVSILGESVLIEDQLIFTPAIPFSRGLNYAVFLRDKQIAKIIVPSRDAHDPPYLVATYPTSDTLPENLLKVYFIFSHPMREGVSLEHISLLNDQNDTLPNVFLALQPELWNKERTALTLWLDPGRIKRELIPNQELGNPIIHGETYKLVVSPDWHDARGLNLSKPYTRQFVVSLRDSVGPNINQWKLDVPGSGTKGPLVIHTQEPLDYFLLYETLAILDDSREKTEASVKISHHETVVSLTPNKPWKPGRYRLVVASYLEDLAGNNLDKLFDRDIRTTQGRDDQVLHEKQFTIR